MAASPTTALSLRNRPSAAFSRLGNAAAGPVAAGVGLAVYVVAMAVHGPVLSDAVFRMADAPTGAYLGASVLSSHSITLPLHSELIPTLLAGLLFRLPAGHLLTQLLGPALAAATVTCMCLTLRRLRVSWLATAMVSACAGPIVLWSVLFPTAHVYTFLAIALVGWVVTRLASQRLSAIAATACAIVGGTALLGDQSFLVVGLLPLGAAGLALSLRRHMRRPAMRAGWLSGASTIVAVAVALLVTARGVHLDTAAALRGDGSASGLGFGVSLAARTFGWMLSGAWYGGAAPAGLDPALAVAGLCVPLVAPVALWQQLRRPDPDDRRLAYLAYWAAADLLLVLAFLALGYAQSIASGRYLIPCALAAVATAPLLRLPRMPYVRLVGGLALGAFAVVQAAGALMVPPAALAGPQAPTDTARILAVVNGLGLSRGYADYWAAAPVMWASNERVHVYPVIPRCDGAGSLCPYLYASPSWYAPARGQSFLLVRKPELCPFGDVTRVFGRPEHSTAVDAESTILVYSYDIASRFGSKPSICF